MAEPQEDKTPDPLGKRALFWGVPSAEPGPTGTRGAASVAMPLGKRALFSSAPVEPDSAAVTSENPLAAHGAFTVECQRCRQTSRVGVLDMLIFQFPIGYWLPRRRFDHRMTCPSCRARAWCSVTLRRS